MNIRYLEILEAIEQTGSFSGAAKKLHLTQSAVSHAVAELERQAGTVLFDRLPRGVSLTHCGAALLEESRGVLAACRNLDRRIRHLEEFTPIHVVSSITIASFWLPRLISCLKRQRPGLQINVRVVSAACAMDILQRGEADIAFLEGPKPQGDFRTVELDSYKLCAACAPAYPLPGPVLSMSELCALPLLLREQGSAIRDTFDSMLALASLKACPVWESVNSFALMKAAEAGLGITILPEMLLSDFTGQEKLKLIQMDWMGMHNKMLAVLHKDRYITQSLQLMLDMIHSVSDIPWL